MTGMSENATRCFLNIVLKRKSLDNLPTFVVLELTRRCNLWCRMCRTPEWWKELKEEDRYLGDMDESVLERARPVVANAERIYLSFFGEPFFHRRCREMIRYIRTINDRAEMLMTSNFTLPKIEDLQTLIDERVSLVNVSIDSPYKSKYEWIRVGANFDTVVNNIKSLIRLRNVSNSRTPAIGFSHVVMKQNISDIRAFIQFAIEFQPHWIILHDVVAGRAHTRSMCLTDEDYAIELHNFLEAEQIAKDQEIPVFGSAVGRFHSLYRDADGPKDEKFGNTTPCIEPFRTLIIDADGTISPCCYYKGGSMGNILSEDFKEIWNGSRYFQLRKSLLSGDYDAACRESLSNGFRDIC